MKSTRLFFCLFCVAALTGVLGIAPQSRADTPLTITVASLTAAPTTVQPGQAINFTVSITASQTVADYPVEYSMRSPGALDSANSVEYIDFAAGQAFTQTETWVVPVDTPPGSYSVTVGVFDPSWTTGYGFATANFSVASTATQPTAPPTSPPSATAPFFATTAAGPNAASFNAPFYSCVRNFYVSTTGSDSNAGTQASPWLTIQQADSSARMPGDCVNVAAGTYNANVVIQHGGNAPTPTGYVVYRCATLDKCHVLAPGQGSLWLIQTPANFSVVDGFEIDGNGTTAGAPDGLADMCIGSSWSANRWYAAPNNDAVHHVWVMNNIVHHCNLTGISFSNKEWIYAIHNTVYHNSWTSGYEGSGIGMVVFRCIEQGNSACASSTTAATGTGTYVPSSMDLTVAAPFHNVFSYNVVYDNSEAHDGLPCGSHTDGNGIILDTFLDQATNTIAYPYQTLVSGNVSYGNGGRGIHVFRTSNVTVANNTVYGNGQDTCINGYYLGDLSQNGGSNNVWINNIAQSVMTAANPTCGGTIPGGVNGKTSFCGHRNVPLVAGNAAGFTPDTNNTYSNNVLYGGDGVQLFDNDAGYFSCTKNKCNTNPNFVSPLVANFALLSTSPAIGYALSQAYLSPAPLDAGACPKAFSACP